MAHGDSINMMRLWKFLMSADPLGPLIEIQEYGWIWICQVAGTIHHSNVKMYNDSKKCRPFSVLANLPMTVTFPMLP